MKCVKCGSDNESGLSACRRCTWPFSISAWSSTTHKIRRVTLDTGCINAKNQNKSLNLLEKWSSEGSLQLQRSDMMLKELKGKERVEKGESLQRHPNLFVLGSSFLGGEDVLSGPDLGDELREILFPKIRALSKNQQFDVQHLRLHILTGGDIFLTLNSNDFITRGRKEKLASHGIWVFTPDDAVDLLKRIYDWI